MPPQPPHPHTCLCRAVFVVDVACVVLPHRAPALGQARGQGVQVGLDLGVGGVGWLPSRQVALAAIVRL
eukprot:364555-Chlamydomonas_euryale.AAC.2